MAVLPINWHVVHEMLMNTRAHSRQVSAFNDLGTVFDTNFTLKIRQKAASLKDHKLVSSSGHSSFHTIYFELERFLKLIEMSIEGCITLYEVRSLKRLAMKTFSHSFIENEKSFRFELRYPLAKVVSDHLGLCLHGYINVDLTSSLGVVVDDQNKSNIMCPDPDTHEALDKLSADLGCLKENSSFSDVTIVCSTANLLAHKNLLSARSSVFKAMFEIKNTKESQTGRVLITDVYEPALRVMLNYIYSGKIGGNLSCELASDVLYAADKYQLPELKKKCIDILKGAIFVENVFKILPIAVLHSESLKFKLFDCIAVNFCEVEKMLEWQALKEKDSTLVMEILSYIVKFQHK